MGFYENQRKKAFAAIDRVYGPAKGSRERRLVNCLNYDLYFGPIGEEPDGDGFLYPGFTPALEELAPMIDELPSDLWWDMQAEELLSEEPRGYEDEDAPGGFVEPFWGDYLKLEQADIRAAVLGAELAKTL